ncbi:MAG: hypothetical protein SGPRY_003802 [Prymnesium sp.]
MLQHFDVLEHHAKRIEFLGGLCLAHHSEWLKWYMLEDEDEHEYMKAKHFNATMKTFVRRSLVLHNFKDEYEVLVVLERIVAQDWQVLNEDGETIIMRLKRAQTVRRTVAVITMHDLHVDARRYHTVPKKRAVSQS